MSKRRFVDADEDDSMSTNPDPKRIKNFDGSASTVNPFRYDPNYKSSHSSDEENEEDMKVRANEMDTDGDDNGKPSASDGLTFDTLLYKLASMNVGETSKEPNETCPICFERVSLPQFPSHVYACLDGMDEGDRTDLRTQVERDEDLALSLVRNNPNYSQDMTWQCPICSKIMTTGMSMNVHANECLDKQEADETNEAFGKFSIGPTGVPAEPPGLRRGTSQKGMTVEQMSACANVLLSNPKGSAEYDSMLEMFETLGFNEQNIRRVVNNSNGNQGGDVNMHGDPPPPSPFMGDSLVAGGQPQGEDTAMNDRGMNQQQGAVSGFNPGMFANPRIANNDDVLDLLGVSDSEI